MRATQLVIFSIALLCLPGFAHAREPHHERGWFYYEPIPEPEKKPDPILPKKPLATESVAPLSSAWLRANLPKYLDRAVDNPTLENVRRYRYLERLAMDRSSAYSDTSARLTMLDPLLDEQSVSPLTALAKATRTKELAAERKGVLARIKAEAGLWFFFRSDCPYCHAQVSALEALKNVHGFSVLPVSIDHQPLRNGGFPSFVKDAGQAAKLGVQVTPSLYLVNRDGRILPLATGLQTMDQIEYRIIELAAELGWVKREELAKLAPLQNTILDDVATEIGNTTDPDSMIDELIARGGLRIGQGTPIETGGTDP